MFDWFELFVLLLLSTAAADCVNFVVWLFGFVFVCCRQNAFRILSCIVHAENIRLVWSEVTRPPQTFTSSATRIRPQHKGQRPRGMQAVHSLHPSLTHLVPDKRVGRKSIAVISWCASAQTVTPTKVATLQLLLRS